ncbi:MAG: hypothetical protein RIA10_11440, partial [Amphiplicatus sp.]
HGFLPARKMASFPAPERRCSYRSMAAGDAASGRGEGVTDFSAFRPVDPSGHSAEGASSA